MLRRSITDNRHRGVAAGACRVWAQHNDLATARRLSVQVEELEAAGRYREAIPLAEKAVATYEGVLGPEHQETATVRGRLAVLYVSSGAFEKAEAALRHSFATFQKTLGPTDTQGAAQR